MLNKGGKDLNECLDLVQDNGQVAKRDERFGKGEREWAQTRAEACSGINPTICQIQNDGPPTRINLDCW